MLSTILIFKTRRGNKPFSNTAYRRLVDPNLKYMLTSRYISGVLYTGQYKRKLRFWKVPHELGTGVGNAWVLQCCNW